MTWNAAVGVLFAAVPAAPSQELPPPTLPPVTVTIPVPGPVTETTVDGSVSVSVSTDLPLPLSGESLDTQPTAPVDTTDATQLPTTSPAVSPAPDDAVAEDGPPPRGPAPDPRPGDPIDPRRRRPGPAPLLQQPRTQLLGAASDAAGEFAPAGAVAALVGLALVADGLIRRRDDLAGMRLDDRDAIVRFE